MKTRGITLARSSVVFAAAALATPLFFISSPAAAYPLDQFEETGMRRLKWQYEVDFEGRRGRWRKNPPGGKWPNEAIKLRMLQKGRDFDLTAETPKDPELQAGLEAILKKWRWKRYNVAVLDITDPSKPRFAGVKITELQTPGSTAKVVVGGAVLDQLRRRFPDDIETRKAMLRGVFVPADEWAHPNHHEVPVIYGKNLEGTVVRRVLTGDTFSLWEWLDHTLSPSSNAAASMTWREATLMRLLGDEYPPAAYDKELFKRWDKQTTTDAAYEVVDAPLLEAGIEIEQFKLRKFFTRNPSRYVKGTTCRVSPLALLQWMVRVEQGRMIDEFSSLELKKMLYLTRRRVRYVYAPILRNSGVFFKSGSLYSCRPEPGFRCGKYMGNRVNVLNSLTEVETPREPPKPKPKPKPKEEVKPAAQTPSPPQAATDPAVTPAIETTEKADDGAPPCSSEEGQDKVCEDHTPPEPAPPPPPYVYIVAVMSNELKRNAASDHASLADEIHKLVTREE